MIKLWPPMCRVVLFCSSGANIYHRVPQIFIGSWNFSTRLQISRMTIWNTRLHFYPRGPAWSVICLIPFIDIELEKKIYFSDKSFRSTKSSSGRRYNLNCLKWKYAGETFFYLQLGQFYLSSKTYLRYSLRGA